MGMFVGMGYLCLSSLINLLFGSVLQKQCVLSLCLKIHCQREMSVLPLHLQFWGAGVPHLLCEPTRIIKLS